MSRQDLASPWQRAALILALMHGLVALMFPLGLAVSSVPFTTETAEAAANSPIVPIAHLAAACILVAGVVRSRWRDMGSVVSASVWVGYSALLAFTAMLRHPHLAMVGPILAAGFSLFAFGLVRCWDPDDETS